LSCAYVIPENGRITAEQIPAKVATQVGVNGTPTPVGQVSSLQACGDSAGWYYERPPVTGDGPPTDTAPTRVTLCPFSCDGLLKASGSRLDVVVGCDDAGAGAP
jgi:hypothetical protein